MPLKPICVPCQRFFRMKKSGFYFIEGMPTPGASPAPGTAEPARWQPYKLWSGDLWECGGCGSTVVVGVGQRPIAEHYEEGFAEEVTRRGANQLQVNDC